MPGTPNHVPSTGPATKAKPKESPMVMPITAITLVRWLSRLRSAASASTAEPTAPSPCRKRPRAMPATL